MKSMKQNNVKRKLDNGFATAYGNSGYVSGKWVDPSWATATGQTDTAGAKAAKTAQTKTAVRTGTAALAAVQKAQLEAEEKAQRQAMLNERLGSSIAQLEEAYRNRRTYLENSYRTSLKNADTNHRAAITDINGGIDRSLQEAYISYIKNREELPQTLASLGIQGGMAESTAARLANQYSAARGNLETTRSGKLAEALAALEKQRQTLLREYSDGIAAEEGQRAKTEAELRLQYAKLL